MTWIALRWILPVIGIEAEEDFQILLFDQHTYLHCMISALTPMLYVWEQYISPRKKSRNSTGYRPESKSRHWSNLAKIHRTTRSDSHSSKGTIASYGDTRKAQVRKEVSKSHQWGWRGSICTWHHSHIDWNSTTWRNLGERKWNTEACVDVSNWRSKPRMTISPHKAASNPDGGGYQIQKRMRSWFSMLSRFDNRNRRSGWVAAWGSIPHRSWKYQSV